MTATIAYDRTVSNLIDELSATGHVTRNSLAAWTRAEAGRGPTVGAGPAGSVRNPVRPAHRHPGDYLSQELGFGSGVPCRRRLAAWNEAGVWDQLPALLLEKLRSAAAAQHALDEASPIHSAWSPPGSTSC
ncbi:hypothetical protein [Streptomyces sp. NPDC058964]|uniref:hypothetical protein n=1 Tax=Streptomyces sp. NPDC058964 TaxID=3346681 RepID=UPI00369392C0